MSNETAFVPLTVPVLAETEDQQAVMAAARSRGYAAGYADGRRAAADEQKAWETEAEAARTAESAEATDRIRVLAEALRAAAVELGEATVPVLEEAREILIAAAFELAEAVVGEALADPVAAARAAVERVLAADANGVVAVVRLNPRDLALLEGSIPADVHMVADPALAPGDAVGELPDGWLDACVGEALARAREALL